MNLNSVVSHNKPYTDLMPASKIKASDFRNYKQTDIKSNEIQNVIRQIIGHYDPLQIVLFGSQAYGIPTEDSDVDLLVVMNTPMKEIEQALHICRTVEYHFALDLIVRKPETIQRRFDLGDPFMQDIIYRGKILYERASDRMDRESRR